MNKMYKLFIHMDTDDDAAIMYNGEQFCLYDENLTINEWFSSTDDMERFVKTRIKVVKGGKAQEMCEDWLRTVVDCISNKNFDDIPVVAGISSKFEAHVLVSTEEYFMEKGEEAVNKALALGGTSMVLKALTQQLGCLSEIGELIRTQDNRMTSHPVFVVQEKVRDYGFDSGYTDNYVWVHDDGYEADPSFAKVLDEQSTVAREWSRVGYRDRWEFVTACFTQQAADRCVDENRHNLREPRVYVASAHRNKEWQKIRQALMDGAL